MIFSVCNLLLHLCKLPANKCSLLLYLCNQLSHLCKLAAHVRSEVADLCNLAANVCIQLSHVCSRHAASIPWMVSGISASGSTAASRQCAETDHGMSR